MGEIMRRRTEVVLAGAIVAALLVAAWAWGPRETERTVCEYCGCRRSVEWRLGIKLRDKTTPQPVTAWVLQHRPDHTLHKWAFLSGSSSALGDSIIADGFGGGYPLLCMLWHGRAALGEQKAFALLDRYHALLASGDQKGLAEMKRKLWEGEMLYGETPGTSAR